MGHVDILRTLCRKTLHVYCLRHFWVILLLVVVVAGRPAASDFERNSFICSEAQTVINSKFLKAVKDVLIMYVEQILGIHF